MNVDRLAANTPDIFEQVREQAAFAAEMGLYKPVFVTSDDRLLGEGNHFRCNSIEHFWNQRIERVEIGDLPFKQASKFLSTLGLRVSQHEGIFNFVGGRLSELSYAGSSIIKGVAFQGKIFITSLDYLIF